MRSLISSLHTVGAAWKLISSLRTAFYGGFPTSRKSRGGHRFASSTKSAPKRMIKLMTYNIWFQQNVKIHTRMDAISSLIKQHRPDVIFFQEVTPPIYKILQGCEMWGDYKCSVPPEEVKMRSNVSMLLNKLKMKSLKLVQINGRDVPIAKIKISDHPSKTLTVATIHLPRQTKPCKKSKIARIKQAKEAINKLDCSKNVVFGGDMNWDDVSDGPFPLPDKWVDAWEELCPMEEGATYDTESNLMLKRRRRVIHKRLDRILCKLENFKLVDVEIIGSDPIPGASYQYQNGKSVPVYPSDHYGLLLTIELN